MQKADEPLPFSSFLFASFVELCVSICIVCSLPLTKSMCVFFSVLSSLILDHFRKMNAYLKLCGCLALRKPTS